MYLDPSLSPLQIAITEITGRTGRTGRPLSDSKNMISYIKKLEIYNSI